MFNFCHRFHVVDFMFHVSYLYTCFLYCVFPVFQFCILKPEVVSGRLQMMHVASVFAPKVSSNFMFLVSVSLHYTVLSAIITQESDKNKRS